MALSSEAVYKLFCEYGNFSPALIVSRAYAIVSVVEVAFCFG